MYVYVHAYVTWLYYLIQICDLDNDNLLSDDEINMFQVSWVFFQELKCYFFLWAFHRVQAHSKQTGKLNIENIWMSASSPCVS